MCCRNSSRTSQITVFAMFSKKRTPGVQLVASILTVNCRALSDMQLSLALISSDHIFPGGCV